MVLRLNYAIIIASCASVILLITILTSRHEQWIPQIPRELPQVLSRPLQKLFSTDPHLNTRLEVAERLWRQSVKDREQMRVAAGRKKFPDGYILPYNVFDFARPSFFCPHDLERVGTLWDGGKWVCGMSRYETHCPGPSSETNPAPELIVYSFGVNDDSSFEAELLRRTNARIYGYDNSVEGWASQISRHESPRATFKKVSIGKISDATKKPPVFSVQDLMKGNGHSYIDIMKMDIEGAEFDALTSLITSVAEGVNNATLPIGQLLIEIHFMKAPRGFTVPKDLDSWMAWWSSLEEMGLRPVQNEDNWIGDSAYGKPRFMEYTMINAMDKERNKLLWS